eukprot:TRINITY_DN5095_c0_g1_i17.p1 TRINITY_DN5095_c0_g1~~TRINITY_DN5095_c0_g1_i17.p1  ORF type:complete len:406 (+),score=130.99 TRINITY_DN5095_c0_g1_i17:160-1377(+)
MNQILESVRPVRWGIIGMQTHALPSLSLDQKDGEAAQEQESVAPSHACISALQTQRGSQVVAVMRPTAALAKQVASTYRIPKCYDKIDALLQDPDVDAVCLEAGAGSSPLGSLLDIALKVCAANKPLLLEVPWVRSHDEALSLVDAFQRKNLPLYVGFFRRSMKKFELARQIVQQYLGVISGVNYRLDRNHHLVYTPQQLGYRIDARVAGGGLFMDYGAHTLDLLDYLLGPLHHVTGEALRLGSLPKSVTVETAVSVTFRTSQPHVALGTASFNFVSGIPHDALEIQGSHGKLTMSLFGEDYPVLHTVLPDGTPGPVKSFQPEQASALSLASGWCSMVASMVAEIRGVAQIPCPCNGRSVLGTALLCDAVLRRYYRDRSDHFWGRPHSWDVGTALVKTVAKPASS